MFGVERWCFTICTLFLLCPRKFYVAPSPSKYWTKSLPNSFEYRKNLFTPRKFQNIVRDAAFTTTAEQSEPGFDFNEEEVKKLKIWPGGAIPYYIDQFSFDKVFRDRIRTFLDVTNGITGLNFLELHRPPDDDKTRWVFFINRQGHLSCSDHPIKNFTSEGVQKILLGYDCLNTGGELAEVVLALVGVPPQHNAPDRHKYIEIENDNVIPEKQYLFEILKDNEWLFHDVDYDFASASHYSLHKYTVNGKATIKPLLNQDIAIGEGKGFSNKDIQKIKMIYNYISKKRLKSVNIPKCNKLFDLGTNNNYNIQGSEDEIQPRKKPNKYLGLPDETTVSPVNNQETNDTTITTSPTQNKNVTEKEDEKEETENLKQKQENASEDLKSDYSEVTKHEDGKSKEKSAKSQHKLDKIDEDSRESLLDLDADNNNKGNYQGLKFTKPGGGR